MDKKYYSNASWSKIPNSKDGHRTKREAEAICQRLMKEYTPFSPCEIRGTCLKAWVTEE